MLYLKSNEPEKFNELRENDPNDDKLPDEMKEQSIEIHEVSFSLDESDQLKSPMIPPN